MNEPSGSPRNLRRDIVFTFALGLACCLAWLIRDVLVMLYVSALFAVVLSPMVRFTAQLRFRRWQPFKGSAVFVLLLVVAGALTAFGFLALPPVISDLQGFAREMPTRLPALLEKLKPFHSPTIWTRRTSARGFRGLSVRRPPICCFPSATGRASSSISSWASF